MTTTPHATDEDAVRKALAGEIRKFVDWSELSHDAPQLLERVVQGEKLLKRALTALRAPPLSLSHSGEPVAWRWRYKDSDGEWAYVGSYPKFVSFNLDVMVCEPLYATQIGGGVEAQRDAIAQVLLERRGFGFYSDPMEGGQDAYDITLEALAEADAILALAAPKPQQVAREPGFVKPDNDQQVFFYEQDFYVLSNFSAFRLKWVGINFDTSEHAYHFLKFRPFAGGTVDQKRIRGGIMNAPSAHDAFKIAEANKHLRRTDWDDVKVETMRTLIRAKVDQHEYVRRKLLATGDRELIEDSWRDAYWGWGPNRDGKNMLGKLWMQVRDELRSSPTELHEGGE